MDELQVGVNVGPKYLDTWTYKVTDIRKNEIDLKDTLSGATVAYSLSSIVRKIKNGLWEIKS